MRRIYKLTLKLIGSVFILAILLHQIDFRLLFKNLSRISPVYLTLAISVSFLGKFVRAASWAKIIGARCKKMFSFLLSLTCINTIMPMKAGRAGAPVLLKKAVPDISKEKSISVTIFTTFLYALFYGSFTLLGAFIFKLSLTVSIAVFIAATIYLGMAFLLFSLGSTSFLQSKTDYLLTFLPQKLKFDREDVLESFKQLGTPKNVGIYSVGWILASLPLQALRVYLLFLAFGFEFSNPLLLLLLPLVAYSVTIIPVSLGGIGLAELSAFTVYQIFGVPSPVAVSVAFMDRFLLSYLPAILGAIFLAKE